MSVKALPRLKELYLKDVVKSLQDTHQYSNAMMIPKITKITLNVGAGEAANDKSIVKALLNDLQRITGQKPVATLARKSIAGFKIRDGWPLGGKVTLRGKVMYEFFDRLVSVALPRVRDFRGVSIKGFDGRGNFSFGFKEQVMFPELDYDTVDGIRGMNITITTTAKTNEEAITLLKGFGFPFYGKGA